MIHHPPPHFRPARRLPVGRNSPQPWEHVVSISGGKDSTALFLLAVERGMPFTATFADTQHEHPAVYEAIDRLESRFGIPIRRVVADFSADMERKRGYIATAWREEGVAEEIVVRALDLLRPSGNAFLDLCMMKGRFPSSKARFCTDELKVRPMFMQVQLPILREGRTIISWQGVRAEESLARRDLARWQRLADPRAPDLPKSLISDEEADGFRVYAYRPIHGWTLDDVWAIHDRHGVERNPLYAKGFSRVGCFPCIMCSKEEIRLVAKWGPEHIDRLEEWESIVAAVAKRGAGTFFAFDKTPGPHTTDHTLPMPGIREVVEWSKTGRGGRQYDLLLADMGTSCSSWGTCE